jgi:hypothetical protein
VLGIDGTSTDPMSVIIIVLLSYMFGSLYVWQLQLNGVHTSGTQSIFTSIDCRRKEISIHDNTITIYYLN